MEKHIPGKGKEVLLALLRGAHLEFKPSPKGYFRAVGKDKKLWINYQRKTLLYAINALHKNKLIEITEEESGTTHIKLTDEGKLFARKSGSVLANSPTGEWDKKWRLVFFDIPEEKKKFRDAFRYQLRKAGLKEFQRSGFIYPWPCFKEVQAIADELGIKENIVLVTAETLSNEFHFRQHFGLV